MSFVRPINNHGNERAESSLVLDPETWCEPKASATASLLAERSDAKTCLGPNVANVRDQSGISLRTPVIMAVGVDDDLAALCTVAARDADIDFIRVAHGPAACRKIPETRPTVVAIAARLWADERNAIADLARSIGARVIELPHVAPKGWQALTLIRAAIQMSDDTNDSFERAAS